MAGPHAKATVVLRDPKGVVVVFEEGAQLPGWALSEITNPEVADQPEVDETAPEAPEETPEPEVEPEAEPEAPAEEDKGDDAPPPVEDKPKTTRRRRTPAAKPAAK